MPGKPRKASWRPKAKLWQQAELVEMAQVQTRGKRETATVKSEDGWLPASAHERPAFTPDVEFFLVFGQQDKCTWSDWAVAELRFAGTARKRLSGRTATAAELDIPLKVRI